MGQFFETTHFMSIKHTYNYNLSIFVFYSINIVSIRLRKFYVCLKI